MITCALEKKEPSFHCYYRVKQPAYFPNLPQNLKQKIDKAHLLPLALKKFPLKYQNVFLWLLFHF